jgi:hypothetical protein
VDYFKMHDHGRSYLPARLRVVQDQDATLAEVVDAIEAEAERHRQPPQPAAEIRRARVRALRLAHESRGLVFNEAEALARLAEVEQRGIIR